MRFNLVAGRKSPQLFALTALCAAVLVGCGGGGDPAANSGTNTASSLSVGGVAATGAAIAAGTVQVNCASGSGTATTAADGSYSITIASGSLPCVLEITSSDGLTKLHSVAVGSGSSAVANITPLTELLVARMAGQDPAAYYASLAGNSAALSSAVTSASVSDAAAAVLATLTSAGIDTSSITDVVSGAIAAGTGTGYDGVLDTLASTLTISGTTLTELVTTVATTSPTNTAVTTSTTTTSSDTSTVNMLPADLLLLPKSAHCAALRSTKYRMITAKPSATTGAADPVTTLDVGTLDAANAAGPTWTWASGGGGTMTAVAGEPCHFTATDANGGVVDAVVAPSGVVVARSSMTGDPSFRMVIGLPMQSFSVSEAAGTWSGMGWVTAGTASVIDSPIVTIASDGALSVNCVNTTPATSEAACTAAGPFTGLSLNVDGGYDVTINEAGSPAIHRAFAFRAGNGEVMIAMLKADGSLHILTRQRALAQMPAVGETYNAWNISLTNTELASDLLTFNNFLITATDGTAQTLTRQVSTVSTGVSHSQTLAVNQARNGWVYRAPGSATASDGSTVAVREMFALKLGVGISAYYLPASNAAGTNARYGLSVKQP